MFGESISLENTQDKHCLPDTLGASVLVAFRELPSWWLQPSLAWDIGPLPNPILLAGLAFVGLEPGGHHSTAAHLPHLGQLLGTQPEWTIH